MPNAKTLVTRRRLLSSETAKKRKANFTDEYMEILKREMNKLRDEEAATHMKRYVRDKFTFVGISMPITRKTHAVVMKMLAKPSRLELMRTLEVLWSQDEREYQYCGIDLAVKNLSSFNSKGDDNELKETLKFVGDVMIRQKSWWDTVDNISSNVVGALLRDHQKLAKIVMGSWNVDADCLWIRRCSLIFQLRYGSDTDMALLFKFCNARCHEREFFIEKSIGWCLRQASKTHANTVRKWADTNKSRLSKLSYKEATKYC